MTNAQENSGESRDDGPRQIASLELPPDTQYCVKEMFRGQLVEPRAYHKGFILEPVVPGKPIVFMRKITVHQFASDPAEEFSENGHTSYVKSVTRENGDIVIRTERGTEYHLFKLPAKEKKPALVLPESDVKSSDEMNTRSATLRGGVKGLFKNLFGGGKS